MSVKASSEPITRATIDDVAELAGVSIKTVSRVVKQEPNVRDATRARVEKAIAKLSFRPNLSARVYVAPGDRRTKSGTPGETANHLVLLAETRQGYHNLIKLVSSGYTQGFYYKPRIDKDLLAAHSAGLIGLSSCLKGEVATGIRTEQQAKAMQAAATYRDILGPGNFFLEMQYQGIDEQRIVNTGLLPIARDLGMPLVCINDVHYLRHGDHKPHDILLCIGTGKSVHDVNRLRYHGDQFFPTVMV